MKNKQAIDDVLSKYSAERRVDIQSICDLINEHIDPKFEFGVQYNMPAWYLPHSIYPDGYHCDPKQPLPFASVASQKKHIGLNFFCLYCDPKGSSRFAQEWKATGKKLDMGKSCIRVKTLADIPLEVVASLFQRIRAKDFVASYEGILTDSAKKKIARLRAKRES